jgi:hypothetical protein
MELDVVMVVRQQCYKAIHDVGGHDSGLTSSLCGSSCCLVFGGHDSGLTSSLCGSSCCLVFGGHDSGLTSSLCGSSCCLVFVFILCIVDVFFVYSDYDLLYCLIHI